MKNFHEHTFEQLSNLQRRPIKLFPCGSGKQFRIREQNNTELEPDKKYRVDRSLNL